MAAFKFFNIGKANEEITRLESRVAELTTENESLKQNGPAVEAAAETLQSDLDSTKSKLAQVESDLSTAKQTISTLTAAKEKAEADLSAASAKLANPGVQIDEAASAKAAAITASIGVPPVAATAPNPQPASKALTGLERAIAAHKESQK